MEVLDSYKQFFTFCSKENLFNFGLNNTFWISKNPFSDQQLQSIGYITSNTPGFIFIADNTVLIVNIQAYSTKKICNTIPKTRRSSFKNKW